MLRDDSYQETLPYHARHTASTSIKSNTRLTQFIQNEDINTGKQMNYYALENYLYNKENSLKYLRIFYHSCYEVIFCVKLEVSNCMKEKHKMEQPERYDLVPTLNDLGWLKIILVMIFLQYCSIEGHILDGHLIILKSEINFKLSSTYSYLYIHIVFIILLIH